MEEHKGELGLSEQGLSGFQAAYTFIICVAWGLAISIILRFHLSRHLRQHIGSRLDEYRRHLLEREREEERWVTGTPTHPLPPLPGLTFFSCRHTQLAVERAASKYDTKRQFYIKKYRADDTV